MALTAFLPTATQAENRDPLGVQHGASQPARKVAILGFGTVGRAVADLCAAHPDALRLTHVFNRNIERKRVSSIPKEVGWTDNFHDILSSTTEIVVELLGGLEPALTFIRQSLLAGKSVITANKHVIAKHGPELFALAAQTGQRIEYGAAVGGALPILPALRYGLSGDRCTRLYGILNGTCNYILSRMEANGIDLAAACIAAQRLGYAENDPSDDLNGFDAACKLAILVRDAFHLDINAWQIHRQSLAGITSADFRIAHKLGCTIRQVSSAEVEGKYVFAAVGPALVSLDSFLARSVDCQNALIITGERSGDTLIAGQGAGGDATAVAVVSDLLGMARSEELFPPDMPRLKSAALIEPLRDHHVRVRFRRKPAGAALLSEALNDAGIGIYRTLSRKNAAEAAFLVTRCRADHLGRVLARLVTLGAIRENPFYLPLL